MMEFTFGRYGTVNQTLFGFGFKSINIGNTRITGYDVSISGKGNVGVMNYLFSVGYTEIDPIKKDFIPEKDTLTATAKYNVLKYRFKTMWKLDAELNYRKITIGMSARYYSFMENIDAVFQDELVAGSGIYAIPGVKRYRELNKEGNWIYDGRLSYLIQKNTTIAFVIKNCFNHEYGMRPADLQPPRIYNLQVSIKF